MYSSSFEYRPKRLNPPPPSPTMRRGGVATAANSGIGSILRSHESASASGGARATRVWVRVRGGPPGHPPGEAGSVAPVDRDHAGHRPGRGVAPWAGVRLGGFAHRAP